MPVATITLASSNGDTVVVSDSNGAYLADDIILDTDPDGLYDTRFTVRTMSGAFQPGGRIVGDTVPIREMVMPFHLTPASRRRFQKLWGTPGNFKRVRYHYDGPSGRRSLTIRLSKEIAYTTEDGFDADIDNAYHAVVSAIAVNPMFESAEDVAEWINPGNFTIYLAATSGTFKLGYGTAGAIVLTAPVAYNADAATVQAALEALPTIGAGNVTVTGDPGHWTVRTPTTRPGTLTVDGTSLAPLSFSITLGTLSYTITIGGQTTAPIAFTSSASTLRQAIEQLSNIGTGGVTVTATLFGYALSFMTGPLNGFLVALFTGKSTAGIHIARVVTNPNTGWFDVWNPTDQNLWPEWELDPAKQWQFPDFGFGQERRWNRPVDIDAARMVVTPELTQLLSVMSDPFMDTYLNADLSNAAGLFNGVEPRYPVPPYTGTEDDPVLMPVVCTGPSGAKVTLRQRRFWSAESGLEA
ncbi:hypothetical protein [Mycobacteroides abscessus]|uniref:hypothetical protein n=1 Tax=Mycobacteroides abscessus TaxID=36809 RepID=UPI00232BB3F3|nr:hypothetical protein [Mycobacteroides abscessus]MDB2211834.1 hypothetical protein [Mycobacteroides abscessus subsp. massiliense]MDB2235316.1 hypothetical protein [Mycobacteroides abscessus subsp. massiliense]WJJ56060.1 minor tail protein [Mycobacterium phage prophiT36-2b]